MKTQSITTLRTRRARITASWALALLLGACTEVDQDTYVGNWSSVGGDILITPSKSIFLHVRSGTRSTYTNGIIASWKGNDLVVGILPGILPLERTIEIDKPPYRDGETWKMHWNENVLVRVPDHAPFATPFSEGFDLEPSGWDVGLILAESTLPKDRQTLIGHWRGSSLDLVIAHNGQVRGKSVQRLGAPIFDGIIEDWTDEGFTIQKRGGKRKRFVIETMPKQKDERWRMTLNGVAMVKVYDFTPVGIHGDWEQRISGSGFRSTLDRQCRRGFYNACILLSRNLDDHWEDDTEPLLAGPAKIGAELYCCSDCNVEQSMTPIRCSGCDPLPADGPCPQAWTCGDLSLHWDPSSRKMECHVPGHNPHE